LGVIDLVVIGQLVKQNSVDFMGLLALLKFVQNLVGVIKWDIIVSAELEDGTVLNRLLKVFDV
jgi:hypothetical protein